MSSWVRKTWKTWSSVYLKLEVLFCLQTFADVCWFGLDLSQKKLWPTLKYLACTIQHICSCYNQMHVFIKDIKVQLKITKSPKGLGLRLTQFDHLVAAVFPPATSNFYMPRCLVPTLGILSRSNTHYFELESMKEARGHHEIKHKG